MSTVIVPFVTFGSKLVILRNVKLLYVLLPNETTIVIVVEAK